MTREEHTSKIMQIKEKIHEIDDGTITNILADLSDDYSALLTDIDNKTLQAEKLQNDNENLRDTNMRLFLRVGEVKTEDVPQDESKKRDYSDLFNEKGELI